MNLNDPVATAFLVADALHHAEERCALFGGLLLAAYGEPRETHDVDIAVVDLSAEAGDVLDASLIEAEVGRLAEESADWDVRGRWQTIRARAIPS